jgi:hypothetical protein
MAQKMDHGAKTRALSLRLDPKTKFMLEFVARIKGQTLTTVVERAIRESCDQVTIRGPGQNEYGNQYNWQQFWDPEEGVRMLSLLASPDYPTNYDADDLKEFTKIHWEFFYRESKCLNPRRSFVQILWPKIETYRHIWNEQRDDYWAAGRAMAADLTAAKLKAPQWPRPAPPPSAPTKRNDIEDEIPF